MQYTNARFESFPKLIFLYSYKIPEQQNIFDVESFWIVHFGICTQRPLTKVMRSWTCHLSTCNVCNMYALKINFCVYYAVVKILLPMLVSEHVSA